MMISLLVSSLHSPLGLLHNSCSHATPLLYASNAHNSKFRFILFDLAHPKENLTLTDSPTIPLETYSADWPTKTERHGNI
jgi:hypothetical protein